MASDEQPPEGSQASRLVLTRHFNVAPETLFAAWIEPEQMKLYWGPAGYSLPVCEVDPCPGGAISYKMRSPLGVEHWNRGRFDQLEPPHRWVTTLVVETPEGQPAFEVVTTIIFTAEDGGTRLDLDTVATPIGDRDPVPTEGMEMGWSQHLDRLAAGLAGRSGPEVVVRRRFDAPPEQVFDAWLDPEAAGRFLFATPDGVMKHVEIDPRVGGVFIVEEERGATLAQHFGEFVEIDRPRRLVFRYAVEENEPKTQVTIVIEPDGDGSLLTLTHVMDLAWADFEEKTRHGWTTILDGLQRLLGSDPFQ